MQTEQVQSVPTVGEIARRCGVNVSQVEYLIKSRGIRAQTWAGNARIFSETDAQYIASELRRITQERGGTR